MTPLLAGTLAVAALAAGIALLVAGGRRSGRARAVDRVQVPARSLSETRTLAGEEHLVEYPAPDGSPLRATVHVARVRVPGQPYVFDGTVWVARDDPTDVVARSWGRQTGGFVRIVVGVVLVVAALGLGLAAGVLAFVGTLPG